MNDKARTPSGTRVDKERWLRTALEVVEKEGGGAIRIDGLARRLKVTKGSFYHHFKDRHDFIDQMVDYWVERFNTYVIDQIQHVAGSPEDRLLTLMRLVKREGLDLYDITFRAWAAQDPKIAAKVREVDLARYRFIRSLFAEIGFEGEELELRTRIWLVVAAANSTVTFPDDGTGDLFEKSHPFFVRK